MKKDKERIYMKYNKCYNEYLKLVSIISLFVLVLFVSSCEDRGIGDMNDTTFRAEIEKKTGLKFPPSAEWIGCEWDEWMEYGIIIAFRAKKSEVDETFSVIREPWSKSTRYLWDNRGIKWYNPDSIKDFRSIEVFYPNPNNCLNVLMEDSATTDSEKILVFIDWNS
jgi:hypothetical protein